MGRTHSKEEHAMTESIDLGLKDINASCACCVTTSSTTDASASTSAAVTTDVLVAGMTCSHCVSSVTEELSAVDLNAGGISRVTIHSATPIDTAAVQAAVEDA